ncbi:hypothetical protein D1867_10985 [Acidianus infernus]|uniref:Uncharacterized protein n=1 Tax=Acidianus infernus TaxID=12915 RepID=A0A6A9QHP4_ACIIN|nr:hypothetical protein [Acidianus infernus]MUM65754.1 hypothetical protein [Acidianus infernus]
MGKRVKGLSEVIGFIILLIIALAILVPLGFYLTSLPTKQEQAQENAESYKALAAQQISEFQPVYNPQSPSPVLPPVYLTYTDGSLYFILTSSKNPPIPVVVKAYLIEYGNNWLVEKTNLVVTSTTVNSTYANTYKAIEIPLTSIYKLNPANIKAVAILTNLGNIIYAYPPTYIPLPSVKPEAIFISTNTLSICILKNPKFELICKCLYLIDLAKQLGTNTLTFWLSSFSYLTAPPGRDYLKLDLSWYGPIAFCGSSSSCLAKFEGYFNGSFSHAYIKIDGNISNAYFIVPRSTFPTLLLTQRNVIINGIAQNIIFTDSLVNNACIINATNINICVGSPSCLVIKDAVNANLHITNSTGCIVFNGTFKGYVYGVYEQKSGKGISISGCIDNGSLIGNITSIKLTSGEGINGCIASAHEIKINSATISGSIASGKIEACETEGEIELGELANGKVVVEGANGYVTTSQNTIVKFLPNPNSFLDKTSVRLFSGIIDGKLNFINDCLELCNLLSPVIISIPPSALNMDDNNGYIKTLGYVITPIKIRFSLQLVNPTNVTEVFTQMPIAIKVSADFQPNSLFTHNCFLGSTTVQLSPPLVLQPFSSENQTFTVSIPVTLINKPQIQNLKSPCINCFQIQYIELTIGLRSTSGYTFTTTILVTPNQIITYPQT